MVFLLKAKTNTGYCKPSQGSTKMNFTQSKEKPDGPANFELKVDRRGDFLYGVVKTLSQQQKYG